MGPAVVDANVMNCFQRERIDDVEGEAHNALSAIFDVTTIALDSEGHCEQEWIDCAGGKAPLALQDWLNDMLALQKIELVTLTGSTMFRELRNLGVPRKDHKWVRLARSANSKMIVTEDIDLYSPTEKRNCSAKRKRAIKAGRIGPVAKYLRKRYGIEVMCCCHVPQMIAENGT